MVLYKEDVTYTVSFQPWIRFAELHGEYLPSKSGSLFKRASLSRDTNIMSLSKVVTLCKNYRKHVHMHIYLNASLPKISILANFSVELKVEKFHLVRVTLKAGLPRSGKNIWKMKFFPGQGSGNFVDVQGNLERTWKVREKSGNLKINGYGRRCLENLFILLKRGKDVISHEMV